MAHDFFTEDPGIKLEMVSRTDSRIEFRLRVLDPKKRCSNKHRENEAIQFDFDIVNDNADDVASEMVKSILNHFYLHGTKNILLKKCFIIFRLNLD